MSAPMTREMSVDADPVAGGADASSVVGEAPFAGTVTAVTYAPVAAITGAATNNRTLSLVNRGQAGAGTTVVASLNYANAVNAAAFDENPITLSVVAGATTVVANDVLEWRSTHIGTGIADPGGRVAVKMGRT